MSRNRNRLILIVIFLLFFIPLLAAVILQSKWVHYEPDHTVNLGALVEPPVYLEESVFHQGELSAEAAIDRRWVLVHPLINDCDAACINVVTLLRQIHISTGRHQEEVAVLLVSTDPLPAPLREELQEIYPRFVIAEDDSGVALEAFTAASNGALPEEGTTYIADPDGNLMLRYDPGYAPADLNKDLRKLLKWSTR